MLRIKPRACRGKDAQRESVRLSRISRPRTNSRGPSATTWARSPTTISPNTRCASPPVIERTAEAAHSRDLQASEIARGRLLQLIQAPSLPPRHESALGVAIRPIPLMFNQAVTILMTGTEVSRARVGGLEAILACQADDHLMCKAQESTRGGASMQASFNKVH